jgi:hypothetical protein
LSYKAPHSYIIRWKLRKLARRLFPVVRKNLSCGIPGITLFNRILDNSAREQYRELIEMLFEIVPEVMSRKIPEANVQQAFVLDTVQKFAHPIADPQILCVGCFEDSAAECLECLGYRIEGIDPVLNYDLNTFSCRRSTSPCSYHVIFSTSVIEHVEDDERFLIQTASLLAPGGTAIITCDYNDQYRRGDRIPSENIRLYTQRDLRERLMPLLESCELVGEPQWDCVNPDFTYAGCRYTFATLVFRKSKQ